MCVWGGVERVIPTLVKNMRRLGLAHLNNFMSLACSKVLTALYVGVGLRVIEYATLLILFTIDIRYDKVVKQSEF